MDVIIHHQSVQDMLKLESLQCDVIIVMASLRSQTQRYGKRLEGQTLSITAGELQPLLSLPAPSPEASPSPQSCSRSQASPPAGSPAQSSKRAVASEAAVRQLQAKRGKIEAETGLPAGVVKDPVTGVLSFQFQQLVDQKDGSSGGFALSTCDITNHSS
jgi:hypothetical protein